MQGTQLITQQYLKDHFIYCPDCGKFSVKKMRKSLQRNKFSIGSEVGTKTQHGYLKISFKERSQYLHRLAFLYMTGGIPECIDHINGDRSDNRWTNLRGCTKQQNCTNRKIVKSSAGLKGVTRKANGFMAQMHYKNKHLYLGHFKTAQEAHEAYYRKSRELNGEFATRGDVHA